MRKLYFLPVLLFSILSFSVAFGNPGNDREYRHMDKRIFACDPPTALFVSAITSTTATISWTAPAAAPAGGYEWEVRSAGAGGSGAAGLASNGATGAGVVTANAVGLTAGSAYTLYVRSVCAAGSDYSTWSASTGFNTPCAATTAPYSQDFESAVAPAIPACTSLETISGNPWTVVSNPGSGFTTKTLRYAYNSSSDADSWFYTRGVTLLGGTSYRLSYRYGNNSTFYEESMKVAYGPSASSASMTNIVADYPSIIGAAPTTKNIDFVPAVTGVYYFGFQSYSIADQYNLYLDDISVMLTPSCEAVSAVTAIGILPTSAQVYFTSTGNDFIVEYGAPGFTPGTGQAAGAGGTVVTGTSSPITIPGLTASTSYDFYVRQICVANTDYSSNVLAKATTLCPPTNVPYTQNFDAAVPPFLPSCTSLQDLNGSPTWFTAVPNSTWGFTGNVLNYTYNASKPANEWFFIQGLNLTAGTKYELSYKYGTLDPGYPERLKVAYGTVANAAAMTTVVKDYTEIYANPAPPYANLERLTFIPAATGVYYFGFQVYSDADQFRLLLDSITVKAYPLVDVGVIGLSSPPVCPAANNVLKAQLHNFNLNTLDFAVNPITVTATITGTANTVLTTTVNTGTLAAGADLEVGLPAFSFVNGAYTIVTSSSSAADPELGNNSNSLLLVVNAAAEVPVITPAAPQICAGGNVQLSTQFTGTPTAAVTLPAVNSGTIDLPIPDNSATGVTSTLSVNGVPAGFSVTGISVTINATHSFNSDLIFNLVGPNGKIINLINRRGGSGADFTNTIISSSATSSLPSGETSPVTGTYIADAVLGVGATGYLSNAASLLQMMTVGNGNWTLVVRDAFAGDDGSIVSWSIALTYGKPFPQITWTPVTSLYTNSGLTTAYAANSNAASVYAKPAGTATYTATATTQFGCTASTPVTVTVNPNPTIAVDALPSNICLSDPMIPLAASPVGGVWSGVGVSGNNFVPSATAIGTYTLVYTSTNNFGCKSVATTSVKVQNCPERVRLLRDSAVILFPNPNNGQFNIRVNSTLYNKLLMRVYNSSGLLARTQQYTGLIYGRVIPIDLSSLPGGTYLVNFSYNEGVRTADKTFQVIIAR